MKHDWVFDVLTDLRRYALDNGLPALAARVDDTLRVARVEIDAGSGLENTALDGSETDEPAPRPDDIPPRGRAN